MWNHYFIIVYLIGLSVFDLKDKSIPMYLIIVGIVLGIIGMVWLAMNRQFGMENMKGLIPGLLLIGIGAATKKVGLADGIILSIVGVFEGYRQTVLLFAASIGIMSLFAIVLLIIKKVKKDTKLPFLPFLCGGYLLCSLCIR